MSVVREYDLHKEYYPLKEDTVVKYAKKIVGKLFTKSKNPLKKLMD